MIYVVTAQKEVFPNDVYTLISVEESLERIKNFPKQMIQFDTETSGLDPHIDVCLMAQFGSIDEEQQIIVDTTTISLVYYKEFLETYFIIGQNLKFDIQVAFNYGIIIKRCFDLMIAEQVLYMGFPSFMIGASEEIIDKYCTVIDKCKVWNSLNKKQKSEYIKKVAPDVQDFIEHHSGVGLAALCYRYLNFYMSKEIRGQINWRGSMDMEVIKYGAGDVTPLYKIMCLQIQRLKKKDLMTAVKIECQFIPCCAYYEYCGTYLNQELWKKKMTQDKTNRQEALKALNQFVVNCKNPKFYKQDLQGDLFTGLNSEPISTINWNSPKQVIPFLTYLGFNCKGIDKDTKEEKDSLDASVLEPQKHINPEFYEIYDAYSKADKVYTTYGQNYLNAVNSNTNRIHTVFRQLGTDTGRLACGSQNQNTSLAKLKGLPHASKKAPKDLLLKCAYPQLQNLPTDEMTRASFCAQPGNAWISIDYCGQESVLMADFSQDEAMLNVFLKGEDMHSTVAYMIYPDKIPRDTPIKDIKKLYKHERQNAKGPEFNIAGLLI